MLFQNLMYYCFSFVAGCVVTCQAIEENSQEVSHIAYVHPIEGTSTTCPFVSLHGSLVRHTFPGVPNYESLENGDAPEPRWVLIIPESEIKRLKGSGFIPQEDIFTSEARGWIQVIAPHSESDPIPFANQQVIIKGYLGSLIFHVHTAIAIEAVRIYGN